MLGAPRNLLIVLPGEWTLAPEIGPQRGTGLSAGDSVDLGNDP